MAIKTIDELKAFFETGDKPTQQQFADWLDSFFHRNDGIGIPNVTGLIAALASKADLVGGKVRQEQLPDSIAEYVGNADFSRDFPAKSIMYSLVCDAANDITINVGTTSGGDDILSNYFVAANSPEPLLLNKYFKNATTIYVSGITANIFFKFFKC